MEPFIAVDTVKLNS